jgi:nucleoside-diphosphate-sugar epimerase
MAFTRFMGAILDNEPLTVLGDGTQVRDFTYVGDIVEGTIAAAQRGRFGAVYNIGGGQSIELNAAIAAIERVAGRPGRVENAPAQRGDAYRTGCDCALALRDLAYAPRTTLEDGLAAQLEWIVRSRRPDVLAEWA